MGGLTIERRDPGDLLARQALRAYFDDIMSRYQGRPAESDEVDAALRVWSSDELVPPTGLLLVARRCDEVLGCAGLRIRPPVGEVTRVFVAAAARRQGLGARLLTAVEDAARHRALSILRLDVRSDLVEARRLYARHGFQEVEPFNADPYVEHWFAKTLAPLDR